MENAEVGQIVKLSIFHFREADGYLLVYKKTDADYVLLSITGQNKRESVNRIIPQHCLTVKLSGYKESFVNLNTLVLVENDFFFKSFRKVKQLEKAIKLSEEESKEINKQVENCFTNESFKGNLYRLRILPENDKKTLMIILG